MTSTHRSRFTQALALAAIIFALAAPAVALGGSSSGTPAPDAFERYAAAHPFGQGVFDPSAAPDVLERYAATHAPAVLIDGRSPDTRDAAEAARLASSSGTPAPDAFERYAAAHPFGQGVLDPSAAPDVLERYAATHAPVVLIDGAGASSPSTVAAASGSQPTAQSGGFDWADASIGAIVTAIMIALIGSLMLVLGRSHRRQRVEAT